MLVLHSIEIIQSIVFNVFACGALISYKWGSPVAPHSCLPLGHNLFGLRRQVANICVSISAAAANKTANHLIDRKAHIKKCNEN